MLYVADRVAHQAQRQWFIPRRRDIGPKVVWWIDSSSPGGLGLMPEGLLLVRFGTREPPLPSMTRQTHAPKIRWLVSDV